MSRHTKKLFTAALGAASLLLLPGSGPARAQTNAAGRPAEKMADVLGDSIVARGKGVSVKRSQLDAEVISRKTILAMRGQALSPEQTKLLERQVLEDIIGRQLLVGMATDADRAKGKQDFEDSLKKSKEELKISDDEFNARLNRQLVMQDLTREQWQQQNIERATAATVLDRVMKITITDADAKKYYDDNPSRFEQAETVRLNHILFSTRDPRTGAPLSGEQQKAKQKLAEEVLKRAKSGDDFVKLAKEYSDDNLSKDKGGEVTIARQQTGLPEFEAAAFSLKTNQISEVITTAIGYDIIRLLEKIPAHKLEFAKVSADLKEGLKSLELTKRLPDYLDQLKKDAGVEILDERLKAVELPKPVLPTTGGTNQADKAAGKK